MCGIAGILKSETENMTRDILSLTHAMRHRGPDDFGFAVFNNDMNIYHSLDLDDGVCGDVFLGHRRLSIIDLNGTKQPLANEDASICVVFNGEIYNYRELAVLLSEKGHVLKESGDTEVLVHLWEEYGEGMTDYLNGMFAFAIYDLNRKVLFLARDRFGQKPLLYMHSSSGGSEFFAFASELNALKQLPGFSSTISMRGVAKYFRYGYIPPPETVYENIFSLLPGHSMILSPHNISSFRIKKYWNSSVNGVRNSVPYEEIQDLIDDSVRLRLITDVPTGGFLSGGLDSAIISASAVKAFDGDYKTYTVSTGNSWCDESREARITAEYLHTDHHEFVVKPDFVNIAEKLAVHYGQPFADFSSIVTYFICKETAKHIKVVLSGDGGDELFGGYGSYLNLRKYSFFGHLSSPVRNILATMTSFLPFSFRKNLDDSLRSARNLPAKGENISSLFHEYWREFCFTSEFLNYDQSLDLFSHGSFSSYYNNAISDDPVEKWMEADQKMYLCGDILHKVDIASMAVSLECRAPFLDFRIAELVNSIECDLKFKNARTKHILRKLADARVPKKISTLPKKGFSFPLDEWLRDSIKSWAESVVFDSSGLWKDLLKQKSVETLWSQHQSGKYDHSARLWQIIAFNLSFSV